MTNQAALTPKGNNKKGNFKQSLTKKLTESDEQIDSGSNPQESDNGAGVLWGPTQQRTRHPNMDEKPKTAPIWNTAPNIVWTPASGARIHGRPATFHLVIYGGLFRNGMLASGMLFEVGPMDRHVCETLLGTSGRKWQRPNYHDSPRRVTFHRAGKSS